MLKPRGRIYIETDTSPCSLSHAGTKGRRRGLRRFSGDIRLFSFFTWKKEDHLARVSRAFLQCCRRSTLSPVDLGPCKRGGSRPLLVGGLPFSCSLSFVRVCVLLREATRRWLSEDGIRFFLPISRPDDVSSIVGARVEVCLERISRDLIGVCLRWIHVDLVFARLCSCVYRLDILDLRFSSLASVAVLLRWSYGVLAR